MTQHLSTAPFSNKGCLDDCRSMLSRERKAFDVACFGNLVRFASFLNRFVSLLVIISAQVFVSGQYFELLKAVNLCLNGSPLLFKFRKPPELPKNSNSQ